MVPSGIRWYFYPTEKVYDRYGSEESSAEEDITEEDSTEEDSTEEDSTEEGSGEEGSAEEGSAEFGQEILEGEFSADRRTLTFSSLEYSNEGIYTVVVENLAGFDYTRIWLDVQGEG